jgi:hypothetical protein
MPNLSSYKCDYYINCNRGAIELRDELAALLQAGLVVAEGGGLTPRRQKLHQRIAEALEAMPANFAEREPESLARHWFAAGQDGCAEVYWLRSRHRVAHWQEQLDALGNV